MATGGLAEAKGGGGPTLSATHTCSIAARRLI